MTTDVNHNEGLDLNELRTAIQDEYEVVAAEPQRGFHFHTGRPLARMLEYKEEWLEGLPERAVESFAGMGNPFSRAGDCPTDCNEPKIGETRKNRGQIISRIQTLPFRY